MNELVTTSNFEGVDGAAALGDWGVIRASGPDAAGFLQAQLTQDIVSLDAARGALAGYCSAKGRLLASFVVVRPERETFLLACSADLLAATLKRLKMFVLRAKCQLDDASAAWPLFGLVGAAARSAGAQAWRCTAAVDGAAIDLRLPDALGQARALRFGALPSSAAALDPAAWSWLEVHSAVTRVVAATVEQFVPQMVNLELVGGVNFQKGCYPGQEVVARSQYRGTLKRRAFVFTSPIAAQAGQELFHSADPSQPAGLVANAASSGGRHAVLAEVKLTALDAGSLHLGAADGPALVRASMPYDIPREAAA